MFKQEENRMIAEIGNKLEIVRFDYEDYQAVVSGNGCTGCAFEYENCKYNSEYKCSSTCRQDRCNIVWKKVNQIYKTPFYLRDGFIFDANHNCLMTDGQICRTIDKVGLTGYNRPSDEHINKAADKITQAIVDALNQSYEEC